MSYIDVKDCGNGIKKTTETRPYRMSWAGRSLLHQIESLVSKNIIGKAKKNNIWSQQEQSY